MLLLLLSAGPLRPSARPQMASHLFRSSALLHNVNGRHPKARETSRQPAAIIVPVLRMCQLFQSRLIAETEPSPLQALTSRHPQHQAYPCHPQILRQYRSLHLRFLYQRHLIPSLQGDRTALDIPRFRKFRVKNGLSLQCLSVLVYFAVVVVDLSWDE